MATKVGTGVSASAGGAGGTIDAPSKNVTAGNRLTGFVKWEVSGVTLSSVADTAGNTYVVEIQLAHSTGGEPHGALFYATTTLGHATNVVTATFSSGSAGSRRIIVEEWSGLSGTIDGTSQSAQGDSLSYSTSSITTTTSGLMHAGVAGFSGLTTPAAGGTPAATLGEFIGSDTFEVYLLSGSGQTVTPGASVASASGSQQWVMVAMALEDTDLTVTVNATPGAWDWTGTNARITSDPATAFQQDAFQSNAFQIFGGTLGGGGVTTVNATPGAWTWAGATATTTQLINAGVGAWTWAGTTASTTQLINAGVGAWTWAGTTATTTQLINAGVGAWTWAGISVSFAGATEVNATPGAWNWAGTTATTTQLINASVGAWNWAGAQASTTQLINAGIGAFSWAGSQASFSQLINASVGAWNWAGTQSEIVQFITINAGVGLWDWTGSQASISDTSTPTRIFAGNRRNYIIKDKKYYNLTNEELCILIARELVDFTREDIRVSYKNKKPHLISKEYFATLQDTLKALEISDVKPVFNDDDDDAFMVLI